MDNRLPDLNRLGWSDWFEERSCCEPGETIARVAAVDRDLALLVDAAGTFRAQLSGAFRYRHRLAEERPAVGDWAAVERPADAAIGLIRAILERRTVLRRRAAGEAPGFQVIAANVDCVIVVQSCDRDFNVKRLERYLVMVTEGGAEAHVLLTKTDLVEPAVVEAQRADIRAAGIAAPVSTLSNLTREGVAPLESALRPRLTYCLVGSSGVGKSTLINHLVGGERQATGAVSGTGEGRHTTVRRELIALAGGALVIDNPGMREFGVLGAERGLDGGFGDILALAARCRYRDCTHTGEPGCAVQQAVQAAEIGREHYENFLKLRKESQFHELSRAERRKKDRDFGKFIKSAKKSCEGD